MKIVGNEHIADLDGIAIIGSENASRYATEDDEVRPKIFNDISDGLTRGQVSPAVRSANDHIIEISRGEGLDRVIAVAAWTTRCEIADPANRVKLFVDDGD